MLIGFKVKNFRSFNDLQHFSMVAGKTRNFQNHIYEINDVKILKFSSLYGANASGKSNLILAIDLGKNLIFNGVSGIVKNQYYRNNEINKNESSYFEYEIEKNGKLYSYGFEININDKTILSEWLIDMTKLEKQVVIFERDTVEKKICSDLKYLNKEDVTRFEACKNDMLNNNQLFFISEVYRRLQMSQNYSAYFNDYVNVFEFFNNDLNLILPNQDRDIKFNYFTKFKTDIKPLLKKLGLDINDLVEVSSTLSEIKERLESTHYNELLIAIDNIRKKSNKFNMILRIDNCIYTINGENDKEDLDIKVIKIVHNFSNVYFDTYEESDGTLRILELIDILLTDNKVYIIDELDRSLHPALSTRFIQCFLDLLEKRNVQLIITTHESRLLTYNLLRRDEIWFAEKNENGATKLYSLEQFKDDARFDRRIDKAYLDGRYGAVPIFVDFPEVIGEITNVE